MSLGEAVASHRTVAPRLSPGAATPPPHRVRQALIENLEAMMRFLYRLFGSWGRGTPRKLPVRTNRHPQLECLEERALLNASGLLLPIPPAPEYVDTLSIPASSANPPPPRSLGLASAPSRNVRFVPDNAGRMLNSEGTPRITVVADFNRDGLPDLVVDTGDRVRIALGQPDGGFRVVYTLSTTATVGETGSLVVGDFNRDGAVDFVAVSRQGKAVFLVGGGDGTFRSALDFSLSSIQATDPRLRDLADSSWISAAAWDPQTQAAFENLGLLPGATRNSLDAHETARPSRTPSRSEHKLSNGRGDGALASSPSPTSTAPQTDASRPKVQTSTPPLTSVSKHHESDDAEQAASAEVLDGSPVAILGATNRGVERLRAVLRTLTSASLLRVPLPSLGSVASFDRFLVDRPRRAAPSTLRTPRIWEWKDAVPTPKPSVNPGRRPIALTPEIEPPIEALESASVAPLEAAVVEPTPTQQGLKFPNWLSWGQVVLPFVYLGTVVRSDAGSVPTMPLQTPLDSRLLLADAIRRSTDTFTRLVQQFYLTFLGRTAVEGEEQGWTSMLLSGRTHEEVLAAFLGTAEYRDRAASLTDQGTPDERFLQSLHQTLLNRSATDDELSGYLAALPVLGREGVAGLLLKSQEYRTLQVGEWLLELTGQPTSTAEAAVWAASPFDLLTLRAVLHHALDPRATS